MLPGQIAYSFGASPRQVKRQTKGKLFVVDYLQVRRHPASNPAYSFSLQDQCLPSWHTVPTATAVLTPLVGPLQSEEEVLLTIFNELSRQLALQV